MQAADVSPASVDPSVWKDLLRILFRCRKTEERLIRLYHQAKIYGGVYTGMGEDINVHDQWAVESQGAIQDRTREHLASSDKAIAANRRLLLRAMAAIEEGQRPPLMQDARAAGLTGPATIDGMAPTAGWEQRWPEMVQRRRTAAPWSPPALAAE